MNNPFGGIVLFGFCLAIALIAAFVAIGLGLAGVYTLPSWFTACWDWVALVIIFGLIWKFLFID